MLVKIGDVLYRDVGFTESGRWGNQGSGILFTTGEKILLLHRSPSVEEPGTWGIPGGAVPQTSRGTFRDPYVSAKQETREELGTVPTHQVVDQYVYEEAKFRYTTYVAKVSAVTVQRFRPTLNWENDDHGWFSQDELQTLDLHFGVVELLRHVDPFFGVAEQKTASTTPKSPYLVWWQKGGPIQWRWRKGGKLYQNLDVEPQTVEDVVQAFADAGVSLEGTDVREGQLHRCPRCRGTGYYGGGQCFACYGNSPVWWDAV